jgi:hypothetical protein
MDLILDTWNIRQFLPADCPLCNEQLIYLYDWMLTQDDRLNVGLFSAYQDAVIGQFYLQMDPNDFQDHLVSTSDRIHQKHPNTFKRFFIEGNSHGVPDYFYQVDGVRIIDWIHYLVSDSPLWTDILE